MAHNSRTRKQVIANDLDRQIFNMQEEFRKLQEGLAPRARERYEIYSAIHALSTVRSIVRRDMHPADIEATKDS